MGLLPAGQGSYGTVYKASVRNTDQVVAVKILPLGQQNEQATIQKEIDMLKECEHPNIVRYMVQPRAEAPWLYQPAAWVHLLQPELPSQICQLYKLTAPHSLPQPAKGAAEQPRTEPQFLFTGPVCQVEAAQRCSRPRSTPVMPRVSCAGQLDGLRRPVDCDGILWWWQRDRPDPGSRAAHG